MTRFQNLIQVHDDELPEAESIESAYKKLYDLPQKKRKGPLIRIAEKGKTWSSISFWYLYRYHAMWKKRGAPAASFNLWEVFVKSDATVYYFLRNHEN